MADERVLVFGASGQVGRELPAALASLGMVTALDRAAADLSDAESLRSVIRFHRPQVIVNAAAYTAVDRAEREPELARAVNAVAPAVLAEEAEALGACIVHYSTDYVFDGTKDGWYAESDAPNPLSVYGRTKLEGELGVARGCARHLIFRTSWVFGSRGATKNFPATMLRLAAERRELRVVADQRGAPTSAALIARVTAEALRRLFPASAESTGQRWGTYHLAAAGETTWHAYALRVIAAGHRAGLPLMARVEDVVPVTTAQYPTPAARPLNSRLGTSKLQQWLLRPGETLPGWERDVDEAIAHLILQSTAARKDDHADIQS